MSEWRKALDALQIDPDDLRCPRCHAMNRPGVTYIEIDEHGHCLCRVCSHLWIDHRPIKVERGIGVLTAGGSAGSAAGGVGR